MSLSFPGVEKFHFSMLHASVARGKNTTMKRHLDTPNPTPSKLVKLSKDLRSETPLPPFSLSSKDEPLNEDDILYFQKEALYRFYKIQYNRSLKLYSLLSKSKQTCHDLKKLSNTLQQWWVQLLEVLKVFYKLEDFNGLTFPEDITQDSLTSLNVAFQDFLKTLSSRVVPEFSSSELSSSFLNYQNQITDLRALNDSLNSDNLDLKSNIDELNITIDTLVKEQERSRSKSLVRIREDDTHVKTNEDNSEKNGIDKRTSSPPLENIKTSAGEDVGEPVDESSISDLNATISSLESKVSVMEEQLNSKIKTINDLNSKISELKTEEKLQSDEKIKNSDIFREVLIEKNAVLDKYNSLTLLNEKIKNQLFELESKFLLNKSSTESKLKSELETNSNYTAKLENDLIRIRRDRDNLQSKISILSTEKSKNDYLKKFNDLIDVLNSRIDELEHSKILSIDSLPKDEQSNVLINELKQIESAFKSIKNLSIDKMKSNYENETLINKLSIEKAKADEKYFQAMRTKDSLSSQNKILSTNLSKQMELIEILKQNEEGLMEKLKIDNSLFEKLLKIENLYNKEILSLRSNLQKLETSLSAKSQVENSLNDKIVQLKIDLDQSDSKLMKLQQDLKSELSRSESYKMSLKSRNKKDNFNADDSIDSDMANALKSMTKCSLCIKNFKNVALKTCGHCFCTDCIEDRLASRMRKCPSCNQQFSRYDLLNIHL